VYEHSVYEDSSVLAGQSRRQWLDDFETLAEAEAAYPHAVVVEGSTYNPYAVGYLSQNEELS
jgi:hypothetical protein